MVPAGLRGWAGIRARGRCGLRQTGLCRTRCPSGSGIVNAGEAMVPMNRMASACLIAVSWPVACLPPSQGHPGTPQPLVGKPACGTGLLRAEAGLTTEAPGVSGAEAAGPLGSLGPKQPGGCHHPSEGIQGAAAAVLLWEGGVCRDPMGLCWALRRWRLWLPRAPGPSSGSGSPLMRRRGV